MIVIVQTPKMADEINLSLTRGCLIKIILYHFYDILISF